jgi:CheY-like chemotaxis protein
MQAAGRSSVPGGPNGKAGITVHDGNVQVRCLIVDDNQAFLRAARELLEREGIGVLGAVSTAAEAYRTCRELNPDVVLLDIDLGDESGFEVARQLASQSDAELPCLILISAYSEDDFTDMIADTPAVAFLPKAGLSGMAIRGILARAGG